MRAKRGEPSKFASYWEMDEEDIEEATEEEIESLWNCFNGFTPSSLSL
jgi:hypothetical protein